MTTFYLIRHAHCDAIGKALAGRTSGIHLSPEGRLQAERLAGLLTTKPIAAVFSSPLERARETAEQIARPLRLKIGVSETWTEIGFGDWTGCRMEDLKGDPEWTRFNAFRSGTRIPAGDMIIEVQARMVTGLEALRRDYPDASVAVVSHADPIKTVIAYAAGIPLDFLFRFEISPASVSTLVLTLEGARIMQLNHTFDSACL